MSLKASSKRRLSCEYADGPKGNLNKKQKTKPADEEAAENLLKLANAVVMTEPQPKPNFSSINSSNGMSKQSNTTGGKPGTAKKLVIKNFKGEFFMSLPGPVRAGGGPGAQVLGGSPKTNDQSKFPVQQKLAPGCVEN